MMSDDLLTVDEVAKILQLSSGTVRRMIRDNRINAINVSSPNRQIWRISRIELDNWLESCKVKVID